MYSVNLAKIFKLNLMIFPLSAWLTLSAASASAEDECAQLLLGTVTAPYKNEVAAWTQSQLGIASIRRQVFGMDNVVRSVLTAIVAKEFVWMNGDPGGAKTFISRTIFESVLRTIPEADKKIFVLQFHKLITEGVITGFPKFTQLMQSGRYEIETATSLVGDRFLFLIADEAEKANPATLSALLSVLNERKAFHGSRVVEAVLSSGVFTSNKTTGEFIQGFGDDRPSGEAFLDRNPIKIHVPNQFATADQSAEYLIQLRKSVRERVDLPILELAPLAAKVQISDELMTDIVQITRSFDSYVTSKADESRKAVRFGDRASEYFPANQFSNRSVRKMIQILKAAFIVEQLWDRVPYSELRTQMRRSDLNLLLTGAAYGGPSRIVLKSWTLGEMAQGDFKPHVVIAEDEWAPLVELNVRWSPWSRLLSLTSVLDGNLKLVIKVNDDGTFITKYQLENLTLDDQAQAQVRDWIRQFEIEQNPNLQVPQFEVDTYLAQLLKRETLPARTREELTSILEDFEAFNNRLNQQMEVSPESIITPAPEREPGVTVREYRELRRNSANRGQVDIKTSFEVTARGARALTQRFPELGHSIEAHFTGILAQEHLFVFGPPGGAKTAVSEVIVTAELRNINSRVADQFTADVVKKLAEAQDGRKFLSQVMQEMRQKQPQQFKRFMLQFHKLIPEGVLTGFVKIDKMLNQGQEEREYTDSMAGKYFLFSILDEVDKANPQTLTALLSLLNEREILAGNEVVKAALRTAIMTSNKMNSEILESFKEDRANAEALMDRALNKVFVVNKLSTEAQLAQFLADVEQGRRPEWRGVLALNELRPLVDQVKVNGYIVHLIEEIREKFMARRLAEAEKSRAANLQDEREFPDYYVPASTMSNRTAAKLQDQLKARLIISQMLKGVAFEDLRFEVQIQDLPLFFEGMAYWAPQSIESSDDSHGIIQFQIDQTILQRLSENPQIPMRVRYQIQRMLEEGTDMVEVLNSEVRRFSTKHRDLLARWPSLFPSLYRGGAQ